MEENVHKTAMPTIAGIFNIISGAGRLVVIPVLFFAGYFMNMAPMFSYRPMRAPVFLAAAAIILLVLGILAIVGGVFALQRRNFGMAMVGAVAALLPFNLLGLASVILLALSSKEFKQ
jgi:hypothetical protein